MAPGPTLDTLRREIDRIDDLIHDLLMRRAALVEEVRRSKGSQANNHFRPGREAEILRRLVQRHSGSFPAAALVRIWREIMSALVRLQGPLSVAVFAPPEYPGYWDLARDHFGSTTPMTRQPTVDHVIRAASEGTATIGILPYPHESSSDPWWRHLASEEKAALRIFARLPFIVGGQGRSEGPAAVAVGRFAQEPTGRDRSLLAIETAEEISRSRFQSGMAKVGFDLRFLSQWQDSGPERAWLHLAEIADFVASSDPRIGRLRRWGKGLITRVIQVGGYAEPLGEDELAETAARTA